MNVAPRAVAQIVDEEFAGALALDMVAT